RFRIIPTKLGSLQVILGSEALIDFAGSKACRDGMGIDHRAVRALDEGEVALLQVRAVLGVAADGAVAEKRIDDHGIRLCCGHLIYKRNSGSKQSNQRDESRI